MSKPQNGFERDEYASTILRSYIYLDEREIDGLYSQLHPNIIAETTYFRNQSVDSIGGALGGSAFGIVKADGTIEQNLSKGFAYEVKTKMTVERKTNIIVDHVRGDSLLSLRGIIEESQESDLLSSGKIFVGFDCFALTSIFIDNKSVSLSAFPYLNNNDYVEMSTFILQNKYTKGIYKIEMCMGGEKMRRNIRHLTHAVREGRTFNFAVLGHLSYFGDIYYSIKPFAIW